MITILTTLDYNMRAYYDEYNDVPDKITDRAFMRVCLHKSLANIVNENVIINKFNKRIDYIKQHYYGLVFCSYREFDRKRITFEQTIVLLSDVLANHLVK